MSEGIMEINPLMPYEDIRADRLSVPAVGLGLAALAKGVSQNTLNITTDTPSGKWLGPTGEVIKPTRLPGMAPAEKLKGLPGLLGIELDKKLEGMSPASPTPKNKGFSMPATEDMKILNNAEEGEPKFKYPTKEELKSYIKEENKFWEEEVIPKANEKRPQLNIKNLPKIVEADKHFGAAAMGFQGFEESQLIYMSPQKYLDLTKRFRPVGTQGEGSKLKSDNIEQLLKDGKELANIPFLNVTKVGDGYKVTGQEGIHRAIAFKNLGYDKMPVVIEGTGTDKVAGVENKVYTATPKSYLYTEPWAKDYIGFIPKSIQSDDEVLLTKPEDFYNVRTKEKLFNGETKNTTTDNFITKEDNVSVTNNLKTQNYLDDKVMNQLLKMRGGSVEGFKELFARSAPMPASTKAKMEMELQNMLFDKYKINEYPEGESPETVNPLRKEYLKDTYHKRMSAVDFITSVSYNVIGEKSDRSILVVDEDGLPLAGAKIAIPGSGKINQSDIMYKDSLVIVEAGSVFRNAGDQLMKDIIQRAKDEGKRFVVAEDVTSEGALQAFKNRGFRTTTTKDTKKFKGQKIRRPGGRSAVQKNLVLDLGAPEKKAYGGLIGKPLSGGSRYI